MNILQHTAVAVGLGKKAPVFFARHRKAVAQMVVAHHKDGSVDNIALSHTYNEQQWAWFKAGSALNLIRANNK